MGARKLSGRLVAPAVDPDLAAALRGSVRVDSIGFGELRPGGRARGAGGVRAAPVFRGVPLLRGLLRWWSALDRSRASPDKIHKPPQREHCLPVFSEVKRQEILQAYSGAPFSACAHAQENLTGGNFHRYLPYKKHP